MIIGHQLEGTDHVANHPNFSIMKCSSCGEHWTVPYSDMDMLEERICEVRFREYLREMLEKDEEWMQRVFGEEFLRPMIHSIIEDYREND